MIPELPPWKLEELREKVVELRAQVFSVVNEYQEAIRALRRDGYYEGKWLDIDENFNYPAYQGSTLFPSWPESNMGDQFRLKYVGDPKPPTARRVWRSFTNHFGRPPAALYRHRRFGWVAEFPRHGRVSLFVDQNLKQIY